MPDLSVAYKLLLESGQQVNIYDWLVAFSTVIEGSKDDDDDDEDVQISQDIQYVHYAIYQFTHFSFLP